MKTSSKNDVNFFSKISYLIALLKMRLNGKKDDEIIPWHNIYEYEELIKKYYPENKNKLNNQRVLEIGYGARPWRLISMQSIGVNIWGIDLDKPSYGFSVFRLLGILKKNGLERFLKSLIRGLFFDISDLKKIEKELKKINKKLIIDIDRMKVGNAADESHFEKNFFTFAFSEDVFEHIPSDVLPEVLKNVSNWLQPDCFLFARPHIYTGISGGHGTDWYPHKVLQNSSPREDAWNHLIDPDFKVNTYLNKMRIDDYIKMFLVHFDIIETIKINKNLGSNYLTEDLKEKLLNNYSEEELLTNTVIFVLKNKKKC